MTRISFQSIETKLYNIPLFGKKVGLNNIQLILDEMNRQMDIYSYLERTPVIHVTGTNGKGSVCNMLSRIYKEAGYRVGLFTSPHIDHITERIQINNRNVSETLFTQGYECMASICSILEGEGIIPTFFEWMFAIGVYCFFNENCDFLVIEVGIGGRLDTTNILPKKVLSIITPIGLDHQNVLGDTIEQIAYEKSGIISSDSRVVLCNDQEVVERIIDCVAKEKNSLCYKVLPFNKKMNRVTDIGIDFSIDNKYYRYNGLNIPTHSEYQIDNAAIVLTALEALHETHPVTPQNIRKGLSDFYWPGRFERLNDKLIIDGAHNPMGAAKLVDTLKHVFTNQKLGLLVGIKEGKDYNEVLNIFIKSGCFEHYYVTDLTLTKSVNKMDIAKVLESQACQVTIIKELDAFLEEYMNHKTGLLIGAGSLYLTSEIRKSIMKEVQND